MSKKEKIPGSLRFEEFYSDLWKDRWPSLKEALLKEGSPVSLSNRLLNPYYMDSASIKAASYLPVKEGDDVLDMCAAPGGKTLVLALKLNGTGSLVSNDRSADRRARLHNVIDSSLPEALRKNITVTGHDGTKWGLYEKDRYDCILLDAPCSSERHVLQGPKALDIWGPNRPKILAVTQYAMLAGAFEAVKQDGYILYSTCSINDGEDSEVVAKLLKKRPGQIEEVPLETNAEKLAHGYIYLPDQAGGTGPLYFCLLRKTAQGKQK